MHVSFAWQEELTTFACKRMLIELDCWIRDSIWLACNKHWVHIGQSLLYTYLIYFILLLHFTHKNPTAMPTAFQHLQSWPWFLGHFDTAMCVMTQIYNWYGALHPASWPIITMSKHHPLFWVSTACIILYTPKNKRIHLHSKTTSKYALIFHLCLFYMDGKWLQGPPPLIFMGRLLLRCAYFWVYTVCHVLVMLWL